MKIYGNFPQIASVLAQRRRRFVEQCMRAVDQTISNILPWRLPQVGRGRRPLTFLHTVARDVGLEVGDLQGVMLVRAVWRKLWKSFQLWIAQSKSK